MKITAGIMIKFIIFITFRTKIVIQILQHHQISDTELENCLHCEHKVNDCIFYFFRKSINATARVFDTKMNFTVHSSCLCGSLLRHHFVNEINNCKWILFDRKFLQCEPNTKGNVQVVGALKQWQWQRNT